MFCAFLRTHFRQLKLERKVMLEQDSGELSVVWVRLSVCKDVKTAVVSG